MSEDKYTHKAFISYSQDPDKEIAKMLEDRIERFGIGWHRLKKQKLFIFRDVTDLVPDNNLPEKIEDALSRSEFLIVLAQKKFSQNDFSWVNVEAEYFVKGCEKRGDDPTDRIILVVTDGEIAWDRNKNQWDYNITNVIPLSLQQIFKHEPLYVDLRLLNEKSASNSQKKKVFNDALIAIVAKLLYKKPSEIQNQIIKLQRYVIGFIALILVFISVLSVYAKIQKDYAVENAEEAIKQEKIAVENAEEAKRQENIAKENEEEAKKQENIAVENAEEAKRQENIAVKNAKEAKRQENIAVDNAKEAKRQENIAVDNAEEARRQENIAKTEKARTDTINKLIAAENLALKSLNFFKSLNDTLVRNISEEVDMSAQNYRDSISKAFALFNSCNGMQKKAHENKLEALYTSKIKSDIFFSNSKIKLDSLFDKVYQTPENKTVVFNLNGQIYDIYSNRSVNLFDSFFHFPDTIGLIRHMYNIFSRIYNNPLDKYYIKKFVQATPDVGTNLILYSNYSNDIYYQFDLKNEKLSPIEIDKWIDTNVIITSADTFILNSKKNRPTFQVQFLEKSQLSAKLEKEILEIKNFGGEFEKVSKIDSIILNDVSCYSIDEYSGRIFWGNINGEVQEYNLIDKIEANNIASFKDRINKILFDQNNQILLVQVGANQLVMFYKLEWGFTKIYQETIGKRINDICLGNDGLIYVLYDRNHLIFWPVKSDLFQEKESKLANH